VGVLNLEAPETSRYSEGHIQYAIEVANRVGWTRAEVLRRQNTSNIFKKYFSEKGISEFTGYLARRRAIEFADLQCALYELDYEDGILIGHSTCNPPGQSNLRHSFEGESLAARVLRTGTWDMLPDAEAAGGKGVA